MLTVLESIKLAKEYLEKHKIENPRLNAELLLSDILKCKRLELYTNFDKPLKEEEIQKFRDYLKRRAQGEPIQYIIGKAYFYGFEFIVTKDVLIPRPETELLVEEILSTYKKTDKIKILDVGSGSGNIGITLGKNLLYSEVHCVDISDKAIEIGKLNSSRLNVSNVKFFNLDILNEIPSESDYDLIVSNPPYISIERQETLQREVRLYEPHIALFVEDETKFYRRIIALSKNILKPGGRVFFEIDDEIAANILSLLQENSFENISLRKDLANLNRIISGVKVE